MKNHQGIKTVLKTMVVMLLLWVVPAVAQDADRTNAAINAAVSRAAAAEVARSVGDEALTADVITGLRKKTMELRMMQGSVQPALQPTIADRIRASIKRFVAVDLTKDPVSTCRKCQGAIDPAALFLKRFTARHRVALR